MAIELECGSCSHEWTVPTAKAGRAVHCPDCDASITVPRPKVETGTKSHRAARGHRPKTDRKSSDRVILLGSVVLLLGVVGLVGSRLMGVMDDDNLGETPLEVLTSDVMGSGQADGAPQDSAADPAAPAVTTDPPPEATTDVAETGEPEPAVASEASPDRENDVQRRKLLAAMRNVTVLMDPFHADRRGAVSETVTTAVQGAMERCRLECVDGDAPVMILTMAVRGTGDKRELWMTANLQPSLQSEDLLWSHSAALGAITDQAFAVGIVPPGLERDTAAFFTTLRSEFVNARREFGPGF